MILTTALFDAPDRAYRIMLNNLQACADKLGYELNVHTLSADPIIPVRHSAAIANFDGKRQLYCVFKPRCIIDTMLKYDDDVLWIDVDCLIQSRVDEMLDDCDACLTLRKWKKGSKRNIYGGYINAGVMAFRKGQQSVNLIQRWLADIPNGTSDQDAMNRLLLQYGKMDRYDEVINIDGFRAKMVNCETYNNFYLKEAKDIKVYHIKSDIRDLFYNVYAQSVLGEKAELI